MPKVKHIVIAAATLLGLYAFWSFLGTPAAALVVNYDLYLKIKAIDDAFDTCGGSDAPNEKFTQCFESQKARLYAKSVAAAKPGQRWPWE